MDAAKLMELMKQKKQSMKRVERAAGFKPGKNRIRLLSGWRPGSEHIWFHDFGQHFVKDAADAVQAVYLCTEHTFGKPCAVCKSIADAMRISGDDATNEILKKAVSGKVILVNALMLDSDNPNDPVVLGIKPKLFLQLTDILEENGPEAFFDLNEGHEIVVTREGKGLNTTYTGQMSIKKGTPIPAAVLSKLHNLDEYVAQQSDEQERRAIAAVNTVAGIAAPSAPATTASAMLAAPSAAAVPARVESPAAAAVTEPPAIGDDLDDLLADLDDVPN
jgi:hypothetical protein